MGTDPQTLAKLQQLLNDPVAGPKLLAMINQQGQSGGIQPSSGVGGDLSNVAGLMSKQQSPSGQLGTGIGGAIGMGIQALRRGAMKKKPTTSSAPGSYLSQAGVAPPSGPSSYLDQIGVAPTPETVGGGLGDAGLVDGGPSDDEEDEYAKGGKVKRGVLVRRPILSTTIVIAKKPESKKPEKKKAKPKPEKKRVGGSIRSGPPAPYAKGGHVQSPRGAGCAERGKQFSGIY